MRDHQHLYRALIDACPDAVLLFDAAGVIRGTNPAAEQLYGYPSADLMGMNVQALDDPANTVPIQEMIRRCQNGARQRFPITRRCKDGTSRSVEVHISTIKVADEVLYVAYERDLSVQLRQELEAISLRVELAEASRLITLNELVSAFRHELNQPLAALRLYVDSATELAAPHDSQPLNECLRRITDKLEQTAQLIRGKYTTRTQLATRAELVNVNAVIMKVLDFLDQDLRKSKIKTHVTLSDELSLVRADEIHLQHVMVNLIRNAIEAMVFTEANDQVLRICSDASPAGVRVSIADSGPGLDSTIAKRLFVPLQTTKSTGLGLGLAICRHLIEAQGGEIGLQSTSAQGTTFYFTLPYCDERASL